MFHCNQNIVFKILDWLFFFILCGFSYPFMLNVLHKYSSIATNFGQYEIPINEHSTITFCFPYFKKNGRFFHSFDFEYGKHFNIKLHKASSYLKEFYLKKGSNFMNNSIPPWTNEVITLEEVVTRKNFYGKCFKISSTFTQLHHQYMSYDIIVNRSYLGMFPSRMKAYFLSEKNSYGIVSDRYKDGDPMKIDVLLGRRKLIRLKPIKKIISNTQAEFCTHDSFYKNLALKVRQANFSNCPRKCYDYSLPLVKQYNIPICNETFEGEKECSNSVLDANLEGLEKNWNKKPCSILQYSGTLGKEVYAPNNHTYAIWVQYPFHGVTTVYEEYFVFDTIGMIGEVGGTLGIFLNFSFTNVFTRLLILAQGFLNRLFFKKLKSPPKIKDIEDESDVKKGSIVVFEMNQRFYQDRLSSLEMDLNEIKEKINKLGD